MDDKKQLKLYLLTQNVACGYDTFESLVVAAPSASAAKRVHPYSDQVEWCTRKCGWVWTSRPDEEFCCPSWASSPTLVRARLIGYAHASLKPGIVLARFNAG